MTKKYNYNFSSEKNYKLIQERDISFEEIIAAIENNCLLDIIEHHNSQKYPNQKMYLIEFNFYVYLVPFVVEDNGTIFLKTIIPSRKATKKYLKETKNNEK
ncbi:MAG: toxin [Rickettsia endosymbiont of Culicoides impunctatus]|uniref:BrnT family toxin n=1 Tax=unclassified Candidatus Tisiphia TaxID=2996318 RepID=UPI001E7AC4FA|nr:MAG: toxin [Rickettsia endosymbiont of Culicoides impunctatus]